jgi:hypothetical protein
MDDTRRRLLTGLLASAAAVRAGRHAAAAGVSSRPGPTGQPAPVAPTSALPPVDAARIAGRVVSSLHPSQGEVAILAHDPAYYPDITREMQVGFARAGATSVVVAFEPPEIVRLVAQDPARGAAHEKAQVAALAPLFDRAAMFVWLPAFTLSPDLRWERLVDGSRVRGVHFHWIQTFGGRSADEIRLLSRVIERAIVETDYGALSREQDRLVAALRGRSIHITADGGTDLRLRVAADAWFHKNDGDLSPARARAGRSARDREMEFPAGALRFIPDVASAEGRLVVRRVATRTGVTAENVSFEFKAGRVAAWSAGANNAAFRADWEAIGGDIDQVGEIVIGTNPLLVGAMPSGDLPYYGYGAGYVRVSLGDNWESGGTNRSPGGRPLWLFLEGASLAADGRPVIERGRLV